MILLNGSSLTIEQLVAIARRGETVAVAPEAARRVRAARAVVERMAREDAPVYGINTGFGSFAEVKIAPEALATLQRNLVRSHAAGVGAPLPVCDVRAAMALRANVLAKGFSGIRPETLDRLDHFAEAMERIAEEAREHPERLHEAPHTTPGMIVRATERQLAREEILRWRVSVEE